MEPEVSVIMAVYNQEKYVKLAIKSILSQSYFNYEFLILDDASSDSSLNIIKSFKDKRIQIFRHIKQLGLAKCLNFLVTKARGQHIARMDADDVSVPYRLKMQIEFLKNHPKFSLVGSWAKIINSHNEIIGKFIYPSDEKTIRDIIISYNPFIHSSVVFKKATFNIIGGYDESLKYCQDYDLFLRMVSRYYTANIPEYLINFRWNADFLKQKEQHKYALKIRLKALKHYNYASWEIIKVIKPLIYFIIPINIKKKYWQSKFYFYQ